MSRHADRSQAFNDIFGRPSTSRPLSTAGPPQLMHGPAGPVPGRAGPYGHAQYGGPPHGHLQQHPSQHYHHPMQPPVQHLQPGFHAGGYAGPSASSGRPMSYAGPSKGYGGGGGYQQLGSIQEQETPVRLAHGSAPAPVRPLQPGMLQHPPHHFGGQPLGPRMHDGPMPAAAMPQQQPYRQPSYGGPPPAGYASPTPDLYASTSSLNNAYANGSQRLAGPAGPPQIAQQAQLSREPSMYNAYPVATVAAPHVAGDVHATPRVHSSVQAGTSLPVAATNSPKLPSLDLDREEFNWFATQAPAMSAMSSTASSSKRHSASASLTGQSGTSGVDTGTSTPSADSAGGISPAHTPGSGVTHESEGMSPGSSGMERLSDYASIDSVPISATSAPAARDFANDVETHRHSPGAMSDPHYNNYRSYSRHSTASTYRTSMESENTSTYQHGDGYDPRTSYPSASTSQTSHTYVNPPSQYYGPSSSTSSHQTMVNGQNQLLRHNSSRRSTESMRVYPTQPKSSSAYGDRSLSFSGMMDRPLVRPPSHSPRNSSITEMPAPSPTSAVSSNMTAPWPSTRRSHRNSESSVVPRRGPVVYPAMLSRVADAFRSRIILAERVKDGLSYTDSFDGREAVDKIAYIIRTTDRNLALLLGRALDAQKFFHDVTYDHRLRDSPHELYQFRERLHSGPFGSGGQQEQRYTHDGHLVPIQRPPSPTDTMLSEDSAVPVGVFTLLTDCYSPTCTRDRLCYSIACPRRLEQQARLNMKLKPGLKKSQSEEGLLGDDDRLGSEPGQLWIQSVSKEISDSVDDTEKKRQEAINELIYTERDFVRDMEYLRDKWMTPLRTGTAVPESRRNAFVDKVFYNVLEIHAVNIKLAEALTRRQKQQPVVQAIGDILLKVIPDFEPFVRYGAHQLYGKYEFEKEKGSNASFLKFVETTERLPESRKLELNGYLTKPTTRLARYPLLLEAILKITPEGNPDKENIPKCVKLVREYLTKVNHESGRTEARFNLTQLTTQLVFRPGEAVDLDLGNENRDLVHKGPLKKKGGTQSESADLQVFLFDHAILMVKAKAGNTGGKEQYKVYRRPIPLELLTISCADEPMTMRQSALRPRSLVSRTSTASSKLSLSLNGTVGRNEPTSKQGFPITFTYLGRKGYALTLWSPSHAGRKKWLDKIEEQQDRTRARSMVLETTVLSEGFFTGTNRISCAAPFDGGSQMIYGTDNGVYLANLHAKDKAPMKVISLLNVTQVEVLEDYGILIVLADRAVQTFMIDNLDPNDAVGAAKRARKISTNATFLKTGVCSNRTLVCIVKSGTVSSTIKTLEPVDPHGKAGKKQPAFRKLLQGNHELLRIYKEFYIPYESSSMHFLKSKLCVGCVKGFEIVDLDTLDTQGLLDPADASLDFVQKRENVRPIAIYRVDGDFLLCYDEFAFYVNKNGWRARATWIVQWEGNPTAFALYYPYIVAFEPNFVEVRHVDTGRLMQIIPGYNVRLLYADTTSASASAAQSAIMPPYAGSQQAMLQQQQMRMSGRPMPGSPHMGMPPSMLPVGFPQPVKVPQTPRKHIVFSGDGCILTLRDVS